MTFLFETIKLGVQNLRLHLLRSILTTSGIVFGIAAVIVMVSIGEGSTRQALLMIESLGATNIIVRSQKPPESGQQQGGQQEQSAAPGEDSPHLSYLSFSGTGPPM